MIDNQTLRKYAEIGALTMCREAVRTFPSILVQLKADAVPSKRQSGWSPAQLRKFRKTMRTKNRKARKQS
jgi:hypothetical protein